MASDFKYWREKFDKHNCIYFCDPKNQNKLNETIENAIKNKEKTIKMGQNGFSAYTKNYTWDIEEKKLVSFYNKIQK